MLIEEKNASGVYGLRFHSVHSHARSTSVSPSHLLLRMQKYLLHFSTGIASLTSCAQPGKIGPVHAQIEISLIEYEILFTV